MLKISFGNIIFSLGIILSSSWSNGNLQADESASLNCTGVYSFWICDNLADKSQSFQGCSNSDQTSWLRPCFTLKKPDSKTKCLRRADMIATDDQWECIEQNAPYDHISYNGIDSPAKATDIPSPEKK